ncbi:hypothetical protein V6N11_022684 [Hibiscus sabdariffa]|uniref:Uncharacterized protein n=1 Tax=Hibiscus sabdariffa TaxID=183260 RepID=A0ABR2TK51_9ROSI
MVNILRRIYLTNSNSRQKDGHAGNGGNDIQHTYVPNEQASRLENSNTSRRQEASISTSIENQSSRKRGRGLTTNTKFVRKKAKGQELDIQFPPPYYKVCGKHANLFKAEVTNCVRQHAPFQVASWKEISENDFKTLWLILKTQSDRNKVNRGHQQIGSIVGTKSIIQKAHEMKDKDSDEWPDAVTLWKATHMKHNGTWSVPNGEEIMKVKLQDLLKLQKSKMKPTFNSKMI